MNSEVQPIILTDEESAQLLQGIGELAQAGLPLDEGLEALSEEVSGNKLRKAFLQLAREIRAGGNPLVEHELSYVRLPKYHQSILIAGIQSHRLGDTLFELLDEETWRREYWRDLWAALSYTLLLATVTLLVVDLLNVFVMPVVQGNFLEIYEDFELDLPFDPTIFKAPPVSWSAFFLVTGAGMLLIPAFLSATQTAMLRRSIPLLGKIFWWYETLDLTVKLRLLVAQNIPTPQALRLASDSLASRRMAQLAPYWASEMDRGRTLADVWLSSMDIPSSILPLIRWGEQSGNLCEAFEAAESLLKDRLAMRRELIQKIGPPIITTMVLAALFWAAIRMAVMFLPLIDLIQNLS
ncbi:MULTISPECIES: type II secretion system F family protein [Pirellulaceae]|nr:MULTISPECIES: type II secretion system F family protein [Pirellulaceae]